MFTNQSWINDLMVGFDKPFVAICLPVVVSCQSKIALRQNA